VVLPGLLSVAWQTQLGCKINATILDEHPKPESYLPSVATVGVFRCQIMLKLSQEVFITLTLKRKKSVQTLNLLPTQLGASPKISIAQIGRIAKTFQTLHFLIE